ncbi:hypothetical protein [Mitsuokella sp. AF21-1AC]|uniref:hypothetical protein n=1 Tax=Mitsuokella sp. AF21-1AC TaxID=2292235 RepID=UPI000E4C6C45|nr:hypothetical protein [Mitsuokella sp. AF21-1AC]RGS73516.1 hypothetical protein DWX75_04060 [Mitsuokella sp. AF21-1AC]
MMKWKKGIAAVLVGIMSFGILSTTLSASAEAASHRNYDPPRIEQDHDRDLHKPQPPKRTHRKETKKSYSTGEMATAAVVGAVVGAVLAKNT